MNSDHESECTFPSLTFKVEENKVPLFFGSDVSRRDQIAFISDKHHRLDGIRIDYGCPEEEFKVRSSLKPKQLLHISHLHLKRKKNNVSWLVRDRCT